jgi:hypothetical protein
LPDFRRARRQASHALASPAPRTDILMFVSDISQRNDLAAASTEVPARPQVKVLHSERLWVSIWWWLGGLGVAGLLAAEVHMGAPGIRSWLPYLIILPIPVIGMYWLGRLRVKVVDDGEEVWLHAGPARLPRSAISKMAVVPASAKTAALGRQLDALAYVQHRVWIKSMVLVVLDDPDDPTPYWLVSTRKPQAVIDALNSRDS